MRKKQIDDWDLLNTPVKKSKNPIPSMSTVDEMIDWVVEKTEEVLESKEFGEKYPNIYWMKMKMNYLAMHEVKFGRLIEYYQDGELIPYLIQTQRRAEEMMEVERERIKEAWEMDEAMRVGEPDKYDGLSMNLEMTLREIVMKYVIEN